MKEKLTEKDFTVSSMHGDMDQNEREKIMKEFRSGSSRVLITTDLLVCPSFFDKKYIPQKWINYCLFNFQSLAGHFGKIDLSQKFSVRPTFQLFNAS